MTQGTGTPSARGARAGGAVAPDSALLRVADLSVAINGHTLVEPLSFSISRSERVGLIGESGSGKSLTASALLGLLPEGAATTGTVSLAGVQGNLLTLGESRLARLRGQDLSMVFQDPLSALNPLQRVGAQVAEVMRLHRQAGGPDAERRAVELLAQVELPDPQAAARAYPHQLSGGQRQRVVLAMALANEPRLLICDEPTTALDVTVQASVLDLISAQVAAHRSGMLFITHDLAVVAQVCQRVLVMNRGRVVESGTVEQIFTRPEHPYTRGLLAASDLEATDASGRLFTIATAAQYPPAAATTGGAGDGSDGEAAAGPAATSPVVGEGKAAGGQAGDAADAEPFIHVAGLAKTYVRTKKFLFGRADEVHALRGVGFDVRRGQRFGIVGESGSGKSTLLKVLTGLEAPSAGTVRVGDVMVSQGRKAELRRLRRDLQLVFQDPFASLDPRMRVADIVAEPLVASGAPGPQRRERARQVLGDVGMDDAALERYPHQFSGGQRQRISIARALATKPRVLVADEPVSALDVSVRAQVLNLLTDLADEYELTVLFVSHDLGVVKHLCTDVAVMRAGRVVETGPVDQIYASPRDDYTAGLVDATPNLARALQESADRRGPERPTRSGDN